ncbi:hypothetical protein D3C72_1855510 [compost metagenome]
MAGELVIPAHVLDAEEVILGGHLGHRDQLDPVLAAAWRVEQQVAEVAGPLALAQGFFELGDVPLVLHRVGDVHDEARVAAVLVVAAAEQGGRLVEQGGVEPANIVGDAVDLLIDVGLHHVAHPACGQGLLLAGLGNPPILVQI